MKKFISALFFAFAAMALVCSWAQTKSVTVMTDKELKAAIDSVAELEQPLTAAPLIAEAKKRATKTRDTKWMLDIIKTDVRLNTRRLTRETSPRDLMASYRDEAWVPLRQAISAECFSIGNNRNDALDALSTPDELRKFKASDVYEKAGDINLLDYLATSLAMSTAYDVNAIRDQAQIDIFNSNYQDFASSTDTLPFPAEAARIMMREGVKAHDTQSVAIAQALRVVLASRSVPLNEESLMTELQGMKVEGRIGTSLVDLAKASALLSGLAPKSADVSADNIQIDKAATLLLKVKNSMECLNDKLSSRIRQCAEDDVKAIYDTTLSIATRPQLVPGTFTPVSLSYRNVDKVILNVYRIGTSAPSKNESVKLEKVAKPANLVMTKKIDLPKTRSKVFLSSAYTEIDGLPNGYYVMTASAANGKVFGYDAFFCSSIAPKIVMSGNEYLMQVSDFGTGAPRPDVKIKDASAPGNEGWLEWGRKNKNIYITAAGDSYSASSYLYGRSSSVTVEHDAQVISDRRIYRPGQTILFKAYFFDRYTNRIEPFSAGKECTARLIGANGKELAKTTLKLDDFGTADGQFTIPDDAMKGSCNVRVKCGNAQGYLYVQVEDFKRTDNTVVFNPFDDVILPGAEAIVSGTCNSAAGLPVSNAKVVYELRKFGEDMVTGETTTADDGSFSFSFKTKEGTYDISVRITDEKGETAEKSQSLRVSPKGIDLDMALKAEMSTIGDGPKLTLNSHNVNGRPYKSQVRLTVTPYEPLDKLRPAIEEEPDSVICDPRNVIFGDATYENNGAKLAAAPVYDQVYEVDGEQSIDLSSLNLPARRYKIEARATALDSTEIKQQKDFLAVADKGRQDGIAYIMLLAPDTVSAGQTLTFRIGSGLEDAYVNVLLSKANKLVVRKQIKLSRGIGKLEYQVPADCINGERLELVVFVQKDGKSYTRECSVTVVKQEPLISLKLTSFRDHSQPGAKEKWTVACTSPDDRTIAASMYDSRLDKYTDNDWDVWFDRLPVDNRLNFINVYAHNYQVTSPDAIGYYFNHSNCTVSTSLLSNVFRNLSYGEGEYYEEMLYGSARGMGRVMLTSAKQSRSSNKMMVMEAADGMSEDSAPMALQESVVTSYAAAPEAAEHEEEDAGEAEDAEPMRENFDETVFFLPSLAPDAEGNANFEFTLPDNLTTYNFRALAIDKKMRYAQIAQTLTVAKAINVQLGLPRFATEGDSLFIPVSVASTDSAATSAKVSIVLSDKETGRKLLSANDMTVALSGIMSAKVGCDFVVPEGVDTLVVEAVGTASTGNRDGEKRLLPVQKRNLEVEESHSFALTDKGTHKLVNPFTDGKTKTLTFNYTSNTFIEVLRALPTLDNSYYPCTDTYLGRFEGASIASLLKSKPDIQKAVKYLDENEGKLKTVGDADHTTWYLVAKRLAQHDKDVVRLLSGNYARKTRTTNLCKLSRIQLSDGSFPWFSGMDGSDFMTVAVASTLGEMNTLGLIQPDDMATVSQILKKSKPYINSLLQKELQWYEDGLKESRRDRYAFRGFSSFALETLQARVLMGDYAGDKTVSKMVSILKENWQYPTMCDRATALFVLTHVGEKAAAQTILKSLEENLVQTKDGTAYIPEDGLFHRRQQVEAQAMLILAFQRLAPESPNAQKVLNHLVLMKRGEAWPDAQSTSRAVLALLASSATISAEDVVEVGDVTVTCTVEKPEVSIALAVDGSVKKAEVTKSNKMTSWGSWHRIMKSPIDELKADGDDKLKITRTIEVRRIVNGDVAWQPVGSEALNIGDEVRVTLKFYNDEALSFVRVRDFRTAAAEPDDKLSGYRGWWFWRWTDANIPTPCHYMSISDDKTEFFIDYLYEGWHSVSYTATITHKGDFAGGYADAQCMYATELMAHTDGVRLTVER